MSSDTSANPNGTNIEKQRWYKRAINSFKPAHPPSQVITSNIEITDDITANVGDDKEAQVIQSTTSMESSRPAGPKLKQRHLQMIAFGGSIGTGLFVGSGTALASGGPASVLIAFVYCGFMVYLTIQALGELAVVFPVSGAFATYSTRFLDPSWGFAMGWNYALQWLVVFPLELVAATMTIDYWGCTVNPAIWIALFWVLIVGINLFGVKSYGESEFIFSSIKLATIIAFIIMSVVIILGGGEQGFIGDRFWYTPGAFNNGFQGVCSVFVTAAFSFAGTELTGLAAAETDNPRSSIPSACKQIIWRIVLFYVLALGLVGLLVPYNSPLLFGGSGEQSSSPFVIAITNAGIKGVPSIINAVILLSILSVGNSSIFGCSRTISSLAEQGLAPKILGYTDRQGRPLMGIAVSAIFGLIAFICASDQKDEVFAWLLAISGLSTLFTWASICFCHIRYRNAIKVQGIKVGIPFKADYGVIGSWIGVFMNITILGVQLWVSLYPVNGKATVKSFMQSYLAVPIVIVCFALHKIIFKTQFVTAKNMDLNTGRRNYDPVTVEEELRIEREAIRARKFGFRVYKFFC